MKSYIKVNYIIYICNEFKYGHRYYGSYFLFLLF